MILLSGIMLSVIFVTQLLLIFTKNLITNLIDLLVTNNFNFNQPVNFNVIQWNRNTCNVSAREHIKIEPDDGHSVDQNMPY